MGLEGIQTEIMVTRTNVVVMEQKRVYGFRCDLEFESKELIGELNVKEREREEPRENTALLSLNNCRLWSRL